jgi:hypothetical protein
MQSRRGARVCGCFSGIPSHVAAMSLNRTEQLLFDYIRKNPDERQHWQDNVRNLAKTVTDPHSAAVRLEAELRRYHEERSRVAAPFVEIARREGVHRISLRNLAEYLLRMWAPARPKRPAAEGNAGAI